MSTKQTTVELRLPHETLRAYEGLARLAGVSVAVVIKVVVAMAVTQHKAPPPKE